MILAPEQNTATAERLSSSRSADSSSGRPRWTPPIPPVARKRIPANAAIRIVAATVVAPETSWASAGPRSRDDTLSEPEAIRSRSGRRSRSRGPRSGARGPARTRPQATARAGRSGRARPDEEHRPRRRLDRTLSGRGRFGAPQPRRAEGRREGIAGACRIDGRDLGRRDGPAEQTAPGRAKLDDGDLGEA